jgi:hypothetical protein
VSTAALTHRTTPHLVVLAASIAAAAILVAAPFMLVVLLAAAAAAVALAAPAHVAIPLAVAILATFQLSQARPLDLGPANVYSTDLLVALIALRAAIPRPRLPASVRWRVIAPLLGPWALVMAGAGFLGVRQGLGLDALFRFEMSLIYLPLLVVGLGAMLRERGTDMRRLVIGAGLVTASLISWMLATRALDMPFETVNQLGKVVTSDGDYLRRDYGLWSAFIVYPIAACATYAYLSHGGRRERWVVALMVASLGATLLTLIRGEIYGLIAGYFVITLLGVGRAWQRMRAVGVVAAAFGLLLLSVWAISPSVAGAIVERSVPDLGRQSAFAQETAEHRFEALRIARKVARDHPTGIGFRSEAQLADRGIDPLYLGHSTGAWLLVYTGWPGLTAAILAFGSLAALSFRAPGRDTWLHPAFLGVMALLAVYSIGASGLLVQPWVIGLAALCVAVRFYAPFAPVSR